MTKEFPISASAGSVLLTGATGFVGHAVLQRLLQDGFETTVAVRRETAPTTRAARRHTITAIDDQTDWSSALKSQACVIHCAARVHIMNDASMEPLKEFRTVNVDGTLNLARQAAEAGVKRFVFLSSIKVNGEGTSCGRSFRADDQPAPQDFYAISKFEAELGLKVIAEQSGMEFAIIRPPLVYGPAVSANFHSMMRWLNRRLPLPFGAIDNRRSLVALDNLVDLIVTCLKHPASANQTFLVSDGEDVSTSELLRRMGLAMGRPARLISVPASVLKLAATLVGRRDIAQRLCGSLQVDIENTRRVLDWSPPISLDEGLRRAAIAADKRVH